MRSSNQRPVFAQGGSRWISASAVASVMGAALWALAGQPAGDSRANSGTRVNTLAKDRDGWQQLLSDHEKITRRLVHRREGSRGIVEAVTESDDPAVALRIAEHARAMQARMVAGAQVRVWDPVFKELFARHDRVRLEVAPTARGVRIVESSDDPETVALLRSHAMGVSEFLREGHAAARRETARLTAEGPLPAGEVTLGGVAHRFLIDTPDEAQLSMLQAQGARRAMGVFRTDREREEADALAKRAGVELVGVVAPGGEGEAIGAVRREFREATASRTALVVWAGAQVSAGPGWAAYLALDRNWSVERAIASARHLGLVDPLVESQTREVIRRELAARGGPAAEPRPGPADNEGELAPTQQEQRRRAERARDQVFARLMSALGEAMSAPGENGVPAGPVGAISVCRDAAPEVARSVSREMGLMIGRTSVRLRNPSNQAPAWARAAVEGSQSSDVSFADGTLGVTFPIKVASTCLACHGTGAEMSADLRKALEKSYSEDRATGYAEGEIRGWFWVEVPPAR